MAICSRDTNGTNWAIANLVLVIISIALALIVIILLLMRLLFRPVLRQELKKLGLLPETTRETTRETTQVEESGQTSFKNPFKKLTKAAPQSHPPHQTDLPVFVARVTPPSLPPTPSRVSGSGARDDQAQPKNKQWSSVSLV